MENLHGKTFPGRKVFITSIVAASPKKAAPHSLDSGAGQLAGEQASPGADPGSTGSSASGKETSNPSAAGGGSPSISPASGPPGSPPPTVKTTDCHSTQLSTDDSSKNLISPGIKEKVDAFSLKQKNDKRKSEFSPDQTAANKEKKKLKEQAKSAKKQEEWKKKQVLISPQHNGH